MDKEEKAKAIAIAIKMDEKGAKQHEIREATRLNASQLWLALCDHRLPQKMRVAEKDRNPETVVRLRDDDGNSWGLIQVRFGYEEFTEGSIRKMYEDASGIKSQGLRIGKGGSFYGNEPSLYDGVRKGGGVEIEAGVTKTGALAVARSLGTNDRRIKADGTAMKVAGAVKKVAKSQGVVKKAAKKAPAKKTVAKKTVAKKTTIDDGKDPFE